MAVEEGSLARDWFGASSHRRIALLADDRRYVGSLTREDLDGDWVADDLAAYYGTE